MRLPVVMLEEFLAPQELGWLWQFALQRSDAFTTSQVIGADQQGLEDPRVRRSRVFYDVAAIHPMVAGRIVHYLPLVLQRLGGAPFALREIELQATVSGDGEFFLPHVDCGGGGADTRVVTFVYFCHREPRGFDGGELRLYDATESDDRDHAAAPLEHVIRPMQNAIVFFPSHFLHEVTRVSCPGNAFADARLTFNGWLHR